MAELYQEISPHNSDFLPRKYPGAVIFDRGQSTTVLSKTKIIASADVNIEVMKEIEHIRLI